MDHAEVEEGNIIDLYLRLELPGDKEIAFEEHLLYCSICRESLSIAESAREASEQGKIEEFRNSGNSDGHIINISRNIFTPFRRIAAGVLIILGISAALMIILKSRSHKPEGQNTVQRVGDTLKSITDTVIPAEKSADRQSGNTIEAKQDHLIAENFTPNRFYENLMENRPRHSGLEMVTPVKDTIIILPVFRWKGEDSKQLTLVLISNREKEILRKTIDNGSELQISLTPGLYYWQLQNDSEALFTGRFIYLPSAGR